MSWQGLEGHDEIAARFAAAHDRGRLAGSYLFVGPPGVGKEGFALALAKAVACGRPLPGLVACGDCRSCLHAAAGSHPDIDVVRKPEDRATLPLELLIGDGEHRMRAGLCWRMLLKPVLGRHRVAVVMDADHFSEEAANCLLKTLEEPPAGSLVILVGTAPERQLPTIRSRCQIVRFRPLPVDVVRRILDREAAAGGMAVDAAAVERAAGMAEGSVTRGLQLLDPAVEAFRGRLHGILAERPLRGVELARETTAFVEAAGKDAAPRRARLRLVFDAALESLRCAAMRAVNADDHAPANAAAARGGDVEHVLAAIECTLDACRAVDRNANLGVLVDAWTAVLEEPRLGRLPVPG